MNNSKEFLGTEPIGKLLFKLAVPSVIAQIVNMLYNIVDRIYIGHIPGSGSLALTGVGVCLPIIMVVSAFAALVGSGGAPRASIFMGKDDMDSAEKILSGCFTVQIIISAILTAVLLLFGRSMLLTFGASENTIDYAVDYMSIYAVGTIFVQMTLGMNMFITAQGFSKTSMLTVTIGAVCNIILDPILIFGWLGFPRMEVAGAAVATVIGQIVAACLALFMNLKFNPDVRIRPSHIRFHWDTVKEIYRVGIPSIVMMSISSIMNFGLNQILIVFSTTATAVFGVYFKLQSFIFMPVFGLNNGMVPIIAYNYGARKPERVKKTIRLSVIAAVCLMLIGLALFEFIPGTLLSLFNATDHMRQIGIPAFRIIAIHFLFAGFCIVSGSVFQAIGNPLHALINSVCRQLVVLLPAAWLLAQSGKLELVWFCFPIAEIFSFILSAIFLRKTLKTANARMLADG